jgi:predicted O-methyltransferase YrrM
MQAKRVLELGVRGGATTLPLLVACSLTKGKLTSIDNDFPGFNCPKELELSWAFVLSDSLKWLRIAGEKQNPYDLVYVDDCHAYEHVKEELTLIENLVTPSSVILLHDLMGSNSQPKYHESMIDTDCSNGGPSRAVRELPRSKWEYATIPKSNGLTLLRKLV